MSRRWLLLLLAAAWLVLAAALIVCAPPALAQALPDPVSALSPAPGAVAVAAPLLLDPQLVVTPSVVLARLPIDGQDERSLWVGNHGTTTLAITVTVLPVVMAEGIVPWLHVTPTYGAVLPHAVLPLTAALDATDLFVGVYMANIIVDSDSPVAPPSVTVPVMLLVDEPWFNAFLPVIVKAGD